MSRKNETLIISAALAEAYIENGTLPDEGFVPSEALIERIDTVNGRAATFTTSASEILHLALDLEEELSSAGLSKRNRVGTIVRHRGAGPTAASYRSAAKGTEVTLARRSSGWVLTEVAAANVYPKQKKLRSITLTADQAEIVTKVALRPFTIAPSSEPAVAA